MAHHTLTAAVLFTFGVLALIASFLLELLWRARQRVSLSAEQAWRSRVPPPSGLEALGDEDEGVDELSQDEVSVKTPLRQLLQLRPDLYASELGATELPELPQEDLVGDIEYIAYLNLEGPRLGDTPLGPDGPRMGGSPFGKGGPVFLPCPVWEPGPEGLTARTLIVVPEPFVRYLYGPGTQDRVRDNTELQELLADAYLRMRKNPLEAIADTWEIRSMYFDLPTARSQPRDPYRREGWPLRFVVDEVDYDDHFQLLSTLMADACRRLAAGSDLEELRAAYKLDPDPKLARRAEQRLAEHRRLEMRWYVESARTYNPKKAEEIARRLRLDQAER